MGLKTANKYARQQVSEMQRTLDGLSFKSLMPKFMDSTTANLGLIALGTSAIYAGKKILDVAGNLQVLKISLDTVTQGHGAEWFGKLNQFALDLPVNLSATIDSFRRMTAMNLKPTIDQMQILVDASSSLGGEEALIGISRALGQIITKGKVYYEELLQLTERGIPAYDILREKLHLTGQQIANIGNLSINGRKAVDAMFEGMKERYGGQIERMKNTYVGQIQIMKNNWMDLQRIMGDIAFPNIIAQLKDLNVWIKENKQQIAEWMGGVIESFISVAKALYEYRNTIIMIVKVAAYAAIFSWLKNLIHLIGMLTASLKGLAAMQGVMGVIAFAGGGGGAIKAVQVAKYESTAAAGEMAAANARMIQANVGASVAAMVAQNAQGAVAIKESMQKAVEQEKIAASAAKKAMSAKAAADLAMINAVSKSEKAALQTALASTESQKKQAANMVKVATEARTVAAANVAKASSLAGTTSTAAIGAATISSNLRTEYNVAANAAKIAGKEQVNAAKAVTAAGKGIAAATAAQTAATASLTAAQAGLRAAVMSTLATFGAFLVGGAVIMGIMAIRKELKEIEGMSFENLKQAKEDLSKKREYTPPAPVGSAEFSQPGDEYSRAERAIDKRILYFTADTSEIDRMIQQYRDMGKMNFSEYVNPTPSKDMDYFGIDARRKAWEKANGLLAQMPIPKIEPPPIDSTIIEKTKELASQLRETIRESGEAETALIMDENEKKLAAIEVWFTDAKEKYKTNGAAIEQIERAHGLKILAVDQENMLARAALMYSLNNDLKNQQISFIRNDYEKSMAEAEQEFISKIHDTDSLGLDGIVALWHLKNAEKANITELNNDRILKETQEFQNALRDLQTENTFGAIYNPSTKQTGAYNVEEENNKYKQETDALTVQLMNREIMGDEYMRKNEEAEQLHYERLIGISNNTTKGMMDDAVSFGRSWGGVMANALQQSGNTFNNIGLAFKNMLANMALEAATTGFMAGLFNMFTGGMGGFGAGFMAGFASIFKGRAAGGPVEKDKPYIVGEKRPELFVPNTAGRIVPKVPEILQFKAPKFPELKAPKIATPEMEPLRIAKPEILKYATPEIPALKAPVLPNVIRFKVPEIPTLKAPALNPLSVNMPESPSLSVPDMRLNAPDISPLHMQTPEPLRFAKPEIPRITTPDISPLSVAMPSMPSLRVQAPVLPRLGVDVPRIPAPAYAGPTPVKINYPKQAAGNTTTVNDNSHWSISITQADAEKMTGLPDEEFARQFKRCERDGRIKVRKTA